MDTLHYNILEPKVKTAHPPLLLMLHGYGSDENDLFSFANELNDRFLIVSARAPRRLPWGGYAWYNIDFTGNESRFGNPEEARQSMLLVENLIAEIQKKYQTDLDKTVLLGFSQGAILSYGLSINNPSKYSGVLALSGYIFNEIMPSTIDPNQFKHLNYFTSHGTEDPVIPIEWARKADAFLTKHHLPHQYHEYDMAHGINPNCFHDLLTWVRNRYHKLT